MFIIYNKFYILSIVLHKKFKKKVTVCVWKVDRFGTGWADRKEK